MKLMGRCCEHGWGIDRDSQAAEDWYRRSAEGGYFRGQLNHATLLMEAGRTAEARRWFEAAVAGAPEASRTTIIAAANARWGLDII